MISAATGEAFTSGCHSLQSLRHSERSSSGSDTPGEGEHKIFKMLEEVRKYILENDQTITNKDKDILSKVDKTLLVRDILHI